MVENSIFVSFLLGDEEEETPKMIQKAKQKEASDLVDDEEKNDEDHKLLIAIAYKVNKLESENEAIVTGLKQNKRYLHSILRHMKQLIEKQDN